MKLCVILLLVFCINSQNFVSSIDSPPILENPAADESHAYDLHAAHIPVHASDHESIASITANVIKPEMSVESPANNLPTAQSFEPLAKDSSTGPPAYDQSTETPSPRSSVKPQEPTPPLTDAPRKHSARRHSNGPLARDSPSETLAHGTYPPDEYSMHNPASKDPDYGKSVEASQKLVEDTEYGKFAETSLEPAVGYEDAELAESYRIEEVAKPAAYWGETLSRIDVSRGVRRQNWKWYEHYSKPYFRDNGFQQKLPHF